ncbi:hypothetical protein V5O48_000711 [Marasmius crinis-equi]|uniref:AMP binding protein n=1 Tax=Marasmius crinis-equi TaxID=585013 RepID=A0ABR3G0H1_9AGAR
MSPRIYTPDSPPVHVPSSSIVTHLFSSPPDRPSDYVGRFPGNLPAFVDARTGTTLTRAQVKSLAFQFGYGLTTIGAKRGDTMLMYSPNSLNWPVVTLGSIAAGIRCTLANNAYTGTELAHQYKDSGSHLLMTTVDGLPSVRDMFKALNISKSEGDKRIILLSESFDWAGGPSVPSRPEGQGLLKMEDLLTRGSLSKEECFDGDAAKTETAFLCYSSGTTGKPKGVETTHQNVTAVVNMVEPGFYKTTPDKDRMLAILPFYHIFGFAKALLFTFHAGVPTVIQQRFEPVEFCANIEKYKITIALVVPPVLVLLARHDVVKRYNLSSLKYFVSGAAPLGGPLVKQVKNRLADIWKINLVIVQGYGLTETSPTTHLLPPKDDIRKVGSIGTLLPNLEARLVVDDEGDRVVDAAEGQPGELWVRGPTVMKGYLNNPAATQNSVTPDRWFKTGDIATRDKEGFYYIVDRRKELIKYKGFQVPPAELESVLLTHPDIADAAVIGVESVAEATELPRAYVVAANPGKVAAKEDKAAFAMGVAKWMESKVAKHKYLRGGVVIIDAIPKSAAGKILRRELRERAKTEVVDQPARARL